VAIVADVLDITERHHLRGNRSQEQLQKAFDRELYFAALEGNVDFAREALKAGADPDGANRNGFRPLHAAAFRGKPLVSRLLLLYGANVAAKSHGGETPLHLAALNGDEVSVRLLTASGASPEVADEDGRTPIWAAAYYGNPSALATLLSEVPNALDSRAARSFNGETHPASTSDLKENPLQPLRQGHCVEVTVRSSPARSPDALNACACWRPPEPAWTRTWIVPAVRPCTPRPPPDTSKRRYLF